MKKLVFAVLLAATSVLSVNSAFADEMHHRVCHKVKVHHHWENRCH
jgi:hypothetical protein